MTHIKAIVRNGRLETETAIDLPDGTELYVPLNNDAPETNDEFATPEEITRVLALMDQVIPFEWTQEERAAWEADQLARKEWEKANFQEYSEQLRKLWS